jgi:hypothetical protein
MYSSSGSGSGMNFPYFTPTSGDSNTQWSSGTKFDISMYNRDGTLLSTRQLIDRYNAILQYSANGETMSYNSIMDATAFLINIGNVWNQLPADEQAEVTKLLKLPIKGPNGGQTTLVDIVAQIGIPSVIEGTYWSSNGNRVKTLRIAQNLLSTLNNTGCSLLNPLLNKTNLILGPGGLTLLNWMDSNPPDKMSFNQFALESAFKWQDAFACNSGAADYLNSIRSMELDYLLAGHTDPFTMYIIIMYVLMNQTNDSQTAISGQGHLTNYLSVPMGNNAREIANAWSACNFDATSAKQFYDKILALEAFSGNRSIASIKPQIDDFYKALTDPKNATQIDVYTDKLGSTTLAKLYQAAQGTAPGSKEWQDLAAGMTSLKPAVPNIDPNNPTVPIQPGYTTLSNLVQQVSNSITSKSTAVGQILQYNEGLFEKQLSFIQATAQCIVNVNKGILQNMHQAGA